MSSAPSPLQCGLQSKDSVPAVPSPSQRNCRSEGSVPAVPSPSQCHHQGKNSVPAVPFPSQHHRQKGRESHPRTPRCSTAIRARTACNQTKTVYITQNKNSRKRTIFAREHSRVSVGQISKCHQKASKCEQSSESAPVLKKLRHPKTGFTPDTANMK